MVSVVFRRMRSGTRLPLSEEKHPPSAPPKARLLFEAEGRAHSLWCNGATGAVEAVPRHTEISNQLARKICRGLSVPEIG